MKDSVTRFTLSLPKRTKDLIEQLAESEGLSVSAMMQQLLEQGLTVEAIRQEGGNLIATFSDGRQITVANDKGRFVRNRRNLP